MRNGRLITIEGISGCGRTTQLHKLAEHLIDEGLTVLCLRESLSYQSSPAGSLPDYDVLETALKAGCTVLAEGFFDCNPKWNDIFPDFKFKQFTDHELLALNIKPDLTFVLELEVMEAQMRTPDDYPARLNRATENWLRSVLFYEKTQATWVEIAAQADWPVHLVPADHCIADIHRQLVYRTRKFLHLPTLTDLTANASVGPEDYERQFQAVQAVHTGWKESQAFAIF